MAERKPGPVQPPTIELTARDAAPKPATPPKTEATKTQAPKMEKNDAATDTAESGATRANAGFAPPPTANWAPLAAAGLGGAVLGTILTYLLANVWALPTPTAPFADPTPSLSAQATRLDAIDQTLGTLGERLGTLEAGTAKTQVSLDATIAQLDAGLNELRQADAETRTAIPAPVPTDLSGIEAELKNLRARIDAIAAGASAADADAITRSLATLETGLAGLATRLDAVDGRLDADGSTLTSLRTDLETANKALSDHMSSALTNEIGPAVKLPLVLSSLESAFAAGRPFSDELAGLRSILPDAIVPQSLAAAATTGLERPERVDAELAARLPAMLAAGAGTPDGDWTQQATDWARTLFALRPIGDIEGAGADAQISRLEAALAQRDYTAAGAVLAAMPAPMRDAAGPLPGAIAAHDAASQLLADLRTRALAPFDGTAN